MLFKLFSVWVCSLRYYVTVTQLDEREFQDDRAGPGILFGITLLLIAVPATLGRRKIKKAKTNNAAAAASANDADGKAEEEEEEEELEDEPLCVYLLPSCVACCSAKISVYHDICIFVWWTLANKVGRVFEEIKATEIKYL